MPVASVIQSDVVVHRKGGGGGGGSQIAPLEIMSSLIARLLRTTQEDHPPEVKVPSDAGARPPSIMPEVWSVEVRDGQYRAVWPGGARVWSLPGNEGGQPPGPSVIRELLTPAEESVFLEEIGRRGSCRWSHPT